MTAREEHRLTPRGAVARRRWVPAVLGGAAALLPAAWATRVSWTVSSPLWWQELPSRLVGLVVVVAGTVLWARSPSPRIGRLMVLGGAVYYLQYLRAADGFLFAIGFCFAYAWIGVAAHIAIGWPSGRVTGLLDRAYVIGSYLASTGTQVIRYLVDRPRPPWAIHLAQPVTLWGRLGSGLAAVMGVLAIGLVVRRWLSATPARRRPSGPVWIGLAVAATVKIAEAVVTVLPSPFAVKVVLASLFYMAVIVLIPLLYLIRWLHLRFAHQRVVDLLVDLERNLESLGVPATLQQALGRALGDPTLTLAYPLDEGGFVDIRGQSVVPDEDAPGRSVTPVRRRGRLIAVLEHDSALDDQRQVTDAAVAAAGLAIENARLYATLQAQLEQIRLSRLRLSQTAFDERLRIQRDLHDGAQQRFYGILMLLDKARRLAAGHGDELTETLHTAQSELTGAVHALRELTHGIYPAVLLEHGLAAAVENLADRAPVPVTFTVSDSRWPRHVEVTAYFVISEALTNVYKHSGATWARVEVRDEDHGLVAEITDNGRGGAVAAEGSGLGGLHHRVDAVGGRLAVAGEPGGGTRLTVVIPDEHEVGAKS